MTLDTAALPGGPRPEITGGYRPAVSAGRIASDDPRAGDVRALIARHLEFARAASPPESVFALEADGLLDPAITLFSYRSDGELLCIGALKELDPVHGELKSMHTAEAARGRGIGAAMVGHLLSVARERGYRRVSLETGSMAEFGPARSLYERAGFVTCGAFGSYRPSEHSSFMTLPLVLPRRSPGGPPPTSHWRRSDA
jgi:putative acetyltransferase